MRIAVIGAGISGNLVARLLSGEHDVELLEANAYAGGHTNTVDVEVDGRCHSVDTGFMVFNRRTYPNFCRLLELLGVDAQDSDMSFSVRCDRTGWEYQGSSLDGLFAQRRNIMRPAFLRMLADIGRFNRLARRAISDDRLDDGVTMGDFLRRHRLGAAFRDQYLVPMTAAIWSTRPERMLDFPARFLLGFCHNHGLLQLRDRPAWQTIPGGARRYVSRLLEPLGNGVRLDCPVRAVVRRGNHVRVTTENGEQDIYDQVVFATHADQTLRLLTDATDFERAVLSAFPYQENQAVLHTDTRLLPNRRRAWASWNYHVTSTTGTVAVTYDLSRLQRVPSTTPILLTLNGGDSIARDRVLRRFRYDHPAYNADSIAAQARHHEISGRNRVHFCGAYWGYGFHEDGVNSALRVARYFGKTLDECKVAFTKVESATTVAIR